MKKRIAFVINTLSGGGAERTVSNLSRGLSKQYDIDIVVNDESHIDYPYAGHILSLQIPSVSSPSNGVYQMAALLRRTHILRRLKRSGNYAAVLSFSQMTSLANVLSGNKYAKTIVSVRNSVGNRKRMGAKQRLFISCILPYICQKADLTVSCSKEIANELMSGFGLSENKSAVIYNGLPLTAIREQAAAPFPAWVREKEAHEKLLVTAGRLTYQKGQWHLLPVMKYLRDTGLPVRLVILGEGELRPLMEERIARLGLADCVSMPGFVENPYAFFDRADAVVMPSLYEGFSNVILEAMACGAPIIATDHETGAREILAPETDCSGKVRDRIEMAAYGILVPVCGSDLGLTEETLSCEERLMADAVHRLLTDDKLAASYRQASLARADQLAIEHVYEQWIEAIETR